MLIFEIIGILLLSTPLIWEIFNDKDGDSHISRGLIRVPSKKIDVAMRLLLAVIAAQINYFITGHFIYSSLFVSFALHLMFFDYIIAFILIKKGIIKGHWFSYLRNKGFDKLVFSRFNPEVRLFIRAGVLLLSFILYFL